MLKTWISDYSNLKIMYLDSFSLFLIPFFFIIKFIIGPGWVAQWVRESSQHTKVAGWMPSQATYKNQPMKAEMSGTTKQCFSLTNP